MLKKSVKNRIKKDLLDNFTYRQISLKHDVSITSVKEIAKSLGLKRYQKVKKEEIEQLAMSGMPTTEISSKLNISLRSVRYNLQKIGLQRRIGRPLKKQASI